MFLNESQPAGARPARPWPADRVERWPTQWLIPYANNPRVHTEADINKLKGSVLGFGWTSPVLVDEDGNVIAGEARLAVGVQLRLDSIPVIVARGWSEAEKDAYRLADNQLAARANWDPERLRIELEELQSAGFDLDLSGFDPDQLETILASLGSNGLTDPDSVPASPDQPVTELGDIWELGDHRVGCGDSTSAAYVTPVLARSEPHLMTTDPPYGVDYDPSWRARRKLGGGKLANGKVLNDNRADWREAYALFQGDVAYVWHGALHSDVVATDLTACGFRLRAQIVWVKQHFTLSRGDYHWKHEACLYAVREGKSSHWRGGRKQMTVWEIASNNPFGNPQNEQTWGHGTQKPVECMRRPIENNTRPGQALYDPFLGSGTSLIAAEMTGRICYGLELHPPLRRCHRATLAGLHRAYSETSSLRSIVRRARRPEGPRSFRSRTWLEKHLL